MAIIQEQDSNGQTTFTPLTRITNEERRGRPWRTLEAARADAAAVYSARLLALRQKATLAVDLAKLIADGELEGQDDTFAALLDEVAGLALDLEADDPAWSLFGRAVRSGGAWKVMTPDGALVDWSDPAATQRRVRETADEIERAACAGDEQTNVVAAIQEVRAPRRTLAAVARAAAPPATSRKTVAPRRARRAGPAASPKKVARRPRRPVETSAREAPPIAGASVEEVVELLMGLSDGQRTEYLSWLRQVASGDHAAAAAGASTVPDAVGAGGAAGRASSSAARRRRR